MLKIDSFLIDKLTAHAGARVDPCFFEVIEEFLDVVIEIANHEIEDFDDSYR
jgi:hypothetical protein